jgi:broad specificity phosphatase PhoE
MMTATILLVRHAAHEQLGRVLSGRGGDVPLSAAGRGQARRLADRLAGAGLDAVHSSPVRRARETAQTLASAAGFAATIAEPLDEIDFGAWTGMSFADLGGDPDWHEWNTRRGDAVPPGGEPMRAVQERVMAHIRAAARQAAGKVVAMVSHADVIRAAVAGVLGLPLGRILGFDIDPASVTRIAAGSWGERVTSLNERCA